MSPNFFIVGAAKSGTTSLWGYLNAHPQVFLPKEKEPSYFSPACHWVKSLDSYQGLFEPARSKRAVAIGEASHAYLTSPESASLLRAYNPDARIIVILRHPVERAYSLYAWMVNQGFEPISSFESALSAEAQRAKDPEGSYDVQGYWRNYLYFSTGCYADQLARYYDQFPREQIRAYLFDDLRTDPDALMGDVQQFLGVTPGFPLSYETYNRGDFPRSVGLQYFAVNRLDGWLARFGLRHANRCRVREFIRRNNSGGGVPPLREETRRKLLALYREDILRTATLIGRDLSHWL